MKISYNWIKQFIQTDKSPEELSGILTDIGLEVESLEVVQTIPGGLEGLVVGHVKQCGQHPNADRLRVTQVDIGSGQDLQIVCGAPNVAAGQKVIVAPVGTTVFPNTGEPFKINKSKIRGEVSEGMICADDEVGLGVSHDGIKVLDDAAVPGTLVKNYFNIEDDFLFEIGLTPNRADAASHLGVARDLAAYLRIPFVVPAAELAISDTHHMPIPVVVENSEACIRYSSITISGVEIKESPSWLKDKLNTIGVRPINNIVDVTNYILHGLGQPMHAFDADEITGGKVVVKNCPGDSLFTTLDGVARKLSSEDLMICNAEEPMCIAGVFGGVKSGITEKTTNVFLESACFSPVSVRKTSKRHGLKTDASFRFERGTDPEMTVVALKQAAVLIRELAGGNISSEVGDFYPVPVKPFTVAFSYERAARLIGKDIGKEETRAIIVALNIRIIGETAEGLELQVPAYKVDVTREVDVIEEVLRIYGYNNIEIKQQIRASLNYSAKPDKEAVQNLVADMLTGNGFFEILTNSLTSSSYTTGSSDVVQVLNPLSTDLDVMRQTLLFSALEAVAYNQNRKSADLKFYEFGKVYHTDGDKFKENQRLSLILSGSVQSHNWSQPAKPLSFYHLKALVDGIVARLNIKGLQLAEVAGDEFSFGLAYKKGEKVLVRLGSVAKSALKKTDIAKEVWYADFDWDLVLKSIRNNKITYSDIPKYPAVRRDLSLLIDKEVTFARLQQIAQKTERSLLKNVDIFDVYEGDKLAPGKKSYALSFLLQDEEKTLTDKTIDGIVQKLILNFEKEAGAEVRK